MHAPETATAPRPSPALLAAIAFLAHGPGLRLFTRYRFTPDLMRTNASALGLTVIAVGVAAAAFPVGRAAAGGAAFVVGHFAWSAYLARRVYRETARAR